MKEPPTMLQQGKVILKINITLVIVDGRRFRCQSIKLFIQTNQPLLIISVIIVVWFLIYTQISSIHFIKWMQLIQSC